MSMGEIRTIKQLVLTVEFVDEMPEVGEILYATNESKSALLVDSIKDDTTAVCLNMRSATDLVKGMKVEASGHSIQVPTGQASIGRILDALGEPLDGLAPVPVDRQRCPRRTRGAL